MEFEDFQVCDRDLSETVLSEYLNAEAIAKAIAYSAAAENVAYNSGYSDPATQAVQGWLKSTGHRQNLEGNYNLTGIGIAKNAKGEYYFTQIFILSR